MKKPSERLTRLPAYAINELAAAKKRLLAAGRDVIDLSAGDADLAPPEIAVETLAQAAADPAMSRYAFQVGLIEFREAAAGYMKRRFDVDVDPMTELLHGNIKHVRRRINTRDLQTLLVKRLDTRTNTTSDIEQGFASNRFQHIDHEAVLKIGFSFATCLYHPFFINTCIIKIEDITHALD